MLHIGSETTLTPAFATASIVRLLLVLVLERQRAAMADQDAAGKAALDRRLRDDAKRTRGGIGGFVDVEIEVPALALGEREQNVEAFAQPGTM